MTLGLSGRLSSMKALMRLPVAVFVVAIPLFLIATNVRLVVNAPVLYSYGFDRYDIPARTGIERSELISAGRQIREYFNDDQDLLDVRVAVRGVLRSIYSQREVDHMKDVKGLVRGVYAAQLLSGLYLLAFAAAFLGVRGIRSYRDIVRYAGVGGIATIGLVVVAGVASLIGFEQVFLAFHLVSFSNDLWQLDPSRDFLIAMFPQAFFFDATMAIGLATVAEAVVLFLSPITLMGWRPWRNLNLGRLRMVRAGAQTRTAPATRSRGE